MNTTAISIGDLSRRTGCNIETIRYYERIGLIPRPDRRGSHRRYARTDVRRLQFVRRARELGFSLEQVRVLLELSEQAAPCCEARRMATAQLEDVRARIADLLRIEKALSETVAACHTPRRDDDCPLIDLLYGDAVAA